MRAAAPVMQGEAPRPHPVDEQTAAQRSVEHAFPAVAAFLGSETAPTRPRTVVVPLLDTLGAALTVACPEWCTSDHSLDVQRGVLAADFTHHGARQELTPGEDGASVLSVRIEQWPFAAASREPFAALWSACGQVEEELTPDGVYALADRLRADADALDCLGVDLDDARRTARLERAAGGEGR